MAKNLEIWIDTKKKFRLSDKHIQMARELGLNPKKFGSLSNHKQQPWKAPLPQFIEDIYYKHFKRESPEVVKPVIQIIVEKKKKKEEKKQQKALKRNALTHENSAAI